MNSENLIKNFRDVGFTINTLADVTVFPEKALYRGGRLNNVFSHGEMYSIPTVLNLRRGQDEPTFPCQYLHVPADDKIENYDTSNGKTRKWINRAIKSILSPQIKLPVLIHCTSGKDRTGVVIAAILKAYGIEDRLIIEEYLLSEGSVDVRLMRQALAGFGDIDKYLNKIGGIELLKQKFEIKGSIT